MLLTNQELMMRYARAVHQQNWPDVMTWTTEIIAKNDQMAHVWANRAVALEKLGFPIDAILNVDKAIELEPDNAAHYSNKGAYYWTANNEEKALANLDKAIEIEPIGQTYMTKGNIYKNRKEMDKALEAYRKCVEMAPTYADGHLVLGTMLLKMGQLEEGWKHYEWRWVTDQLPKRKLRVPEWDGKADLNGRVILVYGEQGLGDLIQFARYVRPLKKRYPEVKIVLEGKAPTKRLFKTISEVIDVINFGDKLPPIDYGIPMLTLAAFFTPTLGSIPYSPPEFRIEPDDIENWGLKFDQFPPLQHGVKVGICWAGMSRADHPHADAIDKIRSTTLQTFAPLQEIPGIVWISLQKGPPKEDLKNAPPKMIIGDFADDMLDFYETCCAIANCDLVISVDTAVLHAAASIGVPTWLLSRWDGCWRWFGDGEHSPWYPSLRQFVQPKPHDWAGLIEIVGKELRQFVESRNRLDTRIAV